MKKLIIISVVVLLSFGATLQNAGASTLSNNQVAVFNDWNYTRHNLFPYNWVKKNPHTTLQQLFNATKPMQNEFQKLITDLEKTSWPKKAEKHAHQSLSASIALKQVYSQILGVTTKQQRDAWWNNFTNLETTWFLDFANLSADMGIISKKAVKELISKYLS